MCTRVESEILEAYEYNNGNNYRNEYTHTLDRVQEDGHY